MSTHDLDQLRRRLPPSSRVQRQTARIQRLADWLHSDTLDELRRIAGESPTPLEEGPGLGHHDGYGPGGQNGPRGSDVSDPTYTRATAKAHPDPTGDAIADLFASRLCARPSELASTSRANEERRRPFSRPFPTI